MQTAPPTESPCLRPVLAQPGNPLSQGPPSLTQCPTRKKQRRWWHRCSPSLPRAPQGNSLRNATQGGEQRRTPQLPQRRGPAWALGPRSARPLAGDPSLSGIAGRADIPESGLDLSQTRPSADAQATSHPSRSGPWPLPRPPSSQPLGPQPGYATRTWTSPGPDPSAPVHPALPRRRRRDRPGRMLSRGAQTLRIHCRSQTRGPLIASSREALLWG